MSPLTKGGELHLIGQLEQLVLLQHGKQRQLAQGVGTLGSVAFVAGIQVLLLLGHKDVEDRRGESAIVAAKGGIYEAAHH